MYLQVLKNFKNIEKYFMACIGISVLIVMLTTVHYLQYTKLKVRKKYKTLQRLYFEYVCIKFY